MSELRFVGEAKTSVVLATSRVSSCTGHHGAIGNGNCSSNDSIRARTTFLNQHERSQTMKGRGARLLGLTAAVVVGGAALLWDSSAYAQHCGNGYRGHYGGYSGGYSSRYYGGHRYQRSHPTWHRPSVHYDRVYHPTYRHWTRSRGLHTHGHYDYVPHYVPGHYDRCHNGHIDLNPRYHR